MNPFQRILDRLTIDNEKSEREERFDSVRRTQELRSFGVPKDLATAVDTGADVKGHKIVEDKSWTAARGALADGVRHIVLSGQTGTGKSLLAAHLLFGTETGGLWIDAAAWAALAPWSRQCSLYFGTPVLVVDDLGMEAQDRTGRLDELIYRRHHDLRLTIYTTNIAKKDFPDSGYSKRTLSRLAEDTEWIPMTTVRRKKRKSK
jgi:hypothetical protein